MFITTGPGLSFLPSLIRRKTGDKKPMPFDKEQPFKNLGIRVVHENVGGKPQTNTVAIEEVELTAREFSGINGIQQLLKTPNF
jgi:hypothetical protein